MTLLDFGFDATPTRTRPRQVAAVSVPEVVQTVTVKPSQAAGYVMREESIWGWQDLRDYVVRQVEMRHGPQVRDGAREASIFKSFLSRYPDNGVAIAKAAFEVHNGMWRNAPISVNRFCKASDQFFADVIAKNL